MMVPNILFISRQLVFKKTKKEKIMKKKHGLLSELSQNYNVCFSRGVMVFLNGSEGSEY